MVPPRSAQPCLGTSPQSVATLARHYRTIRARYQPSAAESHATAHQPLVCGRTGDAVHSRHERARYFFRPRRKERVQPCPPRVGALVRCCACNRRPSPASAATACPCNSRRATAFYRCRRPAWPNRRQRKTANPAGSKRRRVRIWTARCAACPLFVTEFLGTPRQRVASLAPLFACDDEPAALVQWARQQTRVADPLSLWSRDELLRAFNEFCHRRDHLLRNAAAALGRANGHEAVDRVLRTIESPLRERMEAVLTRGR